MELLPEGQKNTTEVLWEDQQRINEFSKLINRKDGWSAQLEKLKQEKEYLDDVSLEIELIDEEEKVGYKIGDTFVQMKQAQVAEKLESESEKLDGKISHLESQIDDTDSLLNSLKSQLYAKFGNAINLER